MIGFYDEDLVKYTANKIKCFLARFRLKRSVEKGTEVIKKSPLTGILFENALSNSISTSGKVTGEAERWLPYFRLYHEIKLKLTFLKNFMGIIFVILDDIRNIIVKIHLLRWIDLQLWHWSQLRRRNFLWLLNETWWLKWLTQT